MHFRCTYSVYFRLESLRAIALSSPCTSHDRAVCYHSVLIVLLQGGIQEQILFTFTVTHKYGETTFAKIKAPGSDYSAFVTQKNFSKFSGELENM